MRIAGLQKLTLLDYPGKTAATVFTPGCNFRCPFCHNAELVVSPPPDAPLDVPLDMPPSTLPGVPLDEFFAFLNKRHGLLDGVCITGGEPLMQPELANFCAHIHELGFAIKLDTNGSFPDRLQKLVEAGLVDYVAMDVKNTFGRYGETTGIPSLDCSPIRASIEFLLTNPVPFEFRTTVVRELHTADNLRTLARELAGAPAWFLQSYLDSEEVLAEPGHYHAWDPADLRALLPELQSIAPAAQLRGID